MPKKIAENDRVRVADRESTAADTKSQLFFPHYRGLSGTVAKVYADNTASVNVDTASLPDDARTRHETGTQAMRQKWLDGLSDEARNRLSAAEKKFGLSYTILVSQDDLAHAEGAPSAEPGRKSLAELEADEARHLDEVRKKAKG